MSVRPFVKWAGGKSQLLSAIKNRYPTSLGNETNRYCEPFVGGGAVLYDILSNYPIQEAMINDINPELIITYRQIQNNIDALIDELDILQNSFLPLSKEQRKAYYYDKRNLFNYLKINGDIDVNLEKAALFIFLNKTCFNGLFRVNRQGIFNVPIGDYKKPLICDKSNLMAIHKLIKNVTIYCGDYKNCIEFINNNTFVYIDPPYRPLSETANFTSYAETLFDDNNQIELQRFVDDISRIGAKVVISNSDPKNSDMDDNFFDKLYEEFSISRISAKRMINCNGESRGNVSELLITNY